MTESNSSSPAPKLRTFRRSSIAAAFLFTLAFACFIVLPGLTIGDFKTRTLDKTFHAHGWPCVHQYRCQLNMTPPLAGKLPPQHERDATAQGLLAEALLIPEGHLEIPPWFNFRLTELYTPDGTTDFDDVQLVREGFWTDWQRWPWSRTGNAHATTYVWSGLLINFAVLLAMFALSAVLVEYLVPRRTRQMQFTVFQFLFLVTVIGILAGELRREYVRAKHERDCVDMLSATCGGSCYLQRKQFGDKHLLLQFLDYRTSLPFSDLQLYQPVESVVVWNSRLTGLPEDKELSESRIKAFNGAQFPIDLVVNLAEPSVKFFRLVDQSRIRSLRIEQRRTWSEYKFPVQFPNLQHLTLVTCGTPGDQRIVDHFVHMDHVPRIDIFHAGDATVEYLLQNQDSLPDNIHVDFVQDISISDQTRREFRRRFPPVQQ